MKQPFLAALALGLLASPSLAKEESPPVMPAPNTQESPAPRAPHGPGDFMAKLDTDKDGKISRAEFQAKGDEMFKEADANNDGYITKEEGMAAHEARRKKWKASMDQFRQNQPKPE